MVETPLLACAAVAVLAGSTEMLHARRVRTVARLAFGPSQRPGAWARCAPFLRVLALSALTWGLLTLILIDPKKHTSSETAIARHSNYEHVLLVLDVSPSMRLVDASPSHSQSRMQRASDVMESFFKRLPVERYRVSVVAVYNGAKPVVIDTTDIDVLRNILGDLPMHYAFEAGKTKLFDGLEEAFKMARPWEPGSTTVIIVSDGDTVPAHGMPGKPASVANVLVVGVGDPLVGKFIDGRQSRQDVSTLRQTAVRLGGRYHNGNEKQLSSSLIADLAGLGEEGPLARLTEREYALMACGLGAGILALLPFLLHYWGTRWNPGVRHSRPSLPRGGPGSPGNTGLGRRTAGSAAARGMDGTRRGVLSSGSREARFARPRRRGTRQASLPQE